MEYIANKQNKTDEMIFSIPDLYKYLDNKYVNSINFEHTYFLTEKVADSLLGMLGYKVMKKKYFEDHSIFYYVQYIGKSHTFFNSIEFYQEYKKMYLDMIDFYRKEVVTLNEKMESFNGKVYLFGGHIFSQFLIYIGLREDKIEAIIDNSNEKNGKRLYGTGLYVFNPSIIEDESQVLVIVKAGRYSNEIEGQLRDINNNIVIYT